MGWSVLVIWECQLKDLHGVPKPLFRLPLLPGMVIEYQYDVSADGRRFVVIEEVKDEQAKRPSVHIVQNWYEEFRDREED